MTAQLSTSARNALLDAIFTNIGASAILELRSGPPPANPATAATGTVLATIQLPATYMAAASGGTKSKTGTWEDTAADATGRVGHVRIWDSTKTNCGFQGIAAGPWKASTAYAVGDVVTNDSGKLYRCTTAGTSNATGGPTGTTASITDGTVTWTYAQAAPEMSLDSSDLTVGQDFIVNTFTVTAPNA